MPPAESSFVAPAGRNFGPTPSSSGSWPPAWGHQAQAALTAAEARTASARAQVAVLEEQLKQTQLAFDQSESDSQGRVAQAEAEHTAAEADRARQEALLKLALFDKDAYTHLVSTGAVSERQGRLSVATADQQEAAVAGAKRRVEANPNPAR